MPSIYTPRNRIVLQAPGENNNAWGDILNDNGLSMIDQALDGVIAFSLSGSKTLTTANGSSDEARCRVLNITGGSGGTVTIPNVEKSYVVRNASTAAVTFTTGSGTTCTVPTNSWAIVTCEGGNVCRSIAIQPWDADLDAVASSGVGGPWTSYSPGIAAQSGSITSASSSGWYRQVGKVVFLQINATITNNGTGAGHIIFSLPFAAPRDQAISGINIIGSTGLCGRVFNTFITLTKTDGTYPGANGANLILNGTYESA